MHSAFGIYFLHSELAACRRPKKVEQLEMMLAYYKTEQRRLLMNARNWSGAEHLKDVIDRLETLISQRRAMPYLILLSAFYEARRGFWLEPAAMVGATNGGHEEVCYEPA